MTVLSAFLGALEEAQGRLRVSGLSVLGLGFRAGVERLLYHESIDY